MTAALFSFEIVEQLSVEHTPTLPANIRLHLRHDEEVSAYEICLDSETNALAHLVVTNSGLLVVTSQPSQSRGKKRVTRINPPQIAAVVRRKGVCSYGFGLNHALSLTLDVSDEFLFTHLSRASATLLEERIRLWVE